MPASSDQEQKAKLRDSSRCTLIDVRTRLKESIRRLASLVRLAELATLLAFAAPAALRSQAVAPPDGPPQNPGVFPLSQIRPGMNATAWTVFRGSTPEPMQVEILGVLRGARGPGQDMILAQLHGTKPEYTGVVEGMSGSPVYIDGKLAGALSYRIGQFTKDPIAGITPIEQMLEVRDIPVRDLASRDLPRAGTVAAVSPSDSPIPGLAQPAGAMEFQAMETPLVMGGFSPDAIRFWQQQTSGTTLQPVAAGGSGLGSSSAPGASTMARSSLVPGSAVSMQLVRGDLEISATCTVTYIDPKQLLACGHPVLGAGPVSLPMTTAEVVTTLASPLNSFKIINTGATVGAFTQDRESAIRGIIGSTAHMIPMHITVDAPEGPRNVNVEILDLPSLTPLAMQVVLYQSLLESNESSESVSYHVTGNIDVASFPSLPLDLWAPAGDGTPAPMVAALQAGNLFTRLYANGTRQAAIKEINLNVQAVPRRVQVTLESARLVSNNIARAGDTIEVEATVRPWQQPEHNVRIAFRLPSRLAPGNLRLLVSDSATLDRALLQPRMGGTPVDLATVLAEARSQHPADRIYVSVLAPETQGELNGATLTSLPLSVANALEPLRNTQNVGLNGESAEVAGDAPAGGVLTGFQILSLHIDPGGGFE